MGQLSLKSVIKTFGDIQVVKSVSLDVTEGEFIVFVGPSGCGKSTLLRMIAGLEHTTAGDIVIDGKRVNDLPPVKRGIAMVFQSYALYPHMSVYENIAFPLRVEGASEAVIREKVNAAAAILHLETRLPVDDVLEQPRRLDLVLTCVRGRVLVLAELLQRGLLVARIDQQQQLPHQLLGAGVLVDPVLGAKAVGEIGEVVVGVVLGVGCVHVRGRGGAGRQG